MSYGNYNTMDNPPFTPPVSARLGGPGYSSYEGPAFGPPRPNYERYAPSSQDDVHYRAPPANYRAEGAATRPPGDTYRAHDQWRARGSQGGPPPPEPWRPAEQWAAQPHGRQFERRSSGSQWEGPPSERSFAPSEAWVSSHSTPTGRGNERYTDSRARPASPPRRSRDSIGSSYATPSAPHPITPTGDAYRPEPFVQSPASARFTRPSDSYRSGRDASPHVPDAQPGPHWRGRTGSASARTRADTGDSHWEYGQERSHSGSPESRSPGSSQVVRNLIAPKAFGSRSSSIEVASPSRPLIQPSRPLRAPAVSVDTNMRPPEVASPSSARPLHPSLPPRPVPTVARETEGDDASGGSSPTDTRKRKTRRGGQARRRNDSSASNDPPSPTSPAASHFPAAPSNDASTATGDSLAEDVKPKDEPIEIPDSPEPAIEALPLETEVDRTSTSATPATGSGIDLTTVAAERNSHSPKDAQPTTAPSEMTQRLNAALAEYNSALSTAPADSFEAVHSTNAANTQPHARESQAPLPLSSAQTRVSSATGRDNAFALQLNETKSLVMPTSLDSGVRSPPPFDIPPGPPLPVKTFEVPRPSKLVFDALKLSITTQKQFGDPGVAVQPIYQANLELRAHVNPDIADPEKVASSTRERASARMVVFEQIHSTLSALATQRQKLVEEKGERLRKEYLERHNAWMARCADLDRASQLLTVPALLEEAAAASNLRTTRRTAAVVGDTVRSDLEMEQIIATLGNEDMFDPAILATRNVAKIPDMISVTHGQVTYTFDDTNNVVEDPASFYDPGPTMAAWTPAEEKIILEQYAANPKQFGKIAEALPNKTVRECVLYYYLHKKKLVDFRKAVTLFGRKGGRGGRARGTKKKGNALLTDIRAHDAEVQAEESVEDDGLGKRRRRNAAAAAAQSISVGANAGRRGPRRSALLATNEATPVTTPEPESRPKRRRAVKPAETPAEQDEGSDSERPAKRTKRGGRKSKVAEAAELDSVSSKPSSSARGEARRKAAGWTNKDKLLFVELLSQHADDWEVIASAMGNKSSVEVFSFYKANKVELQLDAILEGAKESAASPAGSTMLETPAELGTPVSEPPLTTAAPSAPATPPTLNGKPQPLGVHGQSVPGGPWPVVQLGTGATVVTPTYRMPSGYQAAPSTTPYPQYAGSNGTQPPMRPLS
ncbi:hypothetical protein PENSPDRAFT_635197 [Peniophora sp. CONT]|nr:hypothetical protein PENSPDRAFT_635197 [Peniophora sp. CONT]